MSATEAPVFPLDASTIVMSFVRSPRLSAVSSMYFAMRSLMEPVGFSYSHFTKMSTWSGMPSAALFLISWQVVSPTRRPRKSTVVGSLLARSLRSAVDCRISGSSKSTARDTSFTSVGIASSSSVSTLSPCSRQSIEAHASSSSMLGNPRAAGIVTSAAFASSVAAAGLS